jgi:ABC-type nickel/cobalt efflux system permease component RcnA
MKRILSAGILLFAIMCCPVSRIQANPFFGDTEKRSVSPPPVFMTGSGTFIKLQFEFRDKIASFLSDEKDREGGRFPVYFLLLSFVYGILHAAGPGHRKTVVFSLFLSRKASWSEAAGAGFLSAAIHGGSSLAIIGILYLVEMKVLSIAQSDAVYAYAEGITFLILAIMSLALISVAVKELMTHDTEEGQRNGRLYRILIVSSFVPCPGAMMVLLLALYSGSMALGVAGIIAMSLGMGIVISLCGLAACAGRAGVVSAAGKKRERLARISHALEIAGFSVIFLFSSLMAWPFVRSIISMLS